MKVVDTMRKHPKDHLKLATRIERLATLGISELRKIHRELFGRDHTMPNPEFLRRKIAWHLQAEAEGGLPESARQHALAIARDVTLRANSRVSSAAGKATSTAIIPTHDSRLPMPGCLIVKEYKGKTIVVTVLDDGFEFDGRRFTSLSTIANEITGSRWNGFAFFGLTKEGKRGR